MLRIQSKEVTLEDFVGQGDAKRIIQMLIDDMPTDGLIPHLLFIGDAGSGKTTMTKAIQNTIGQIKVVKLLNLPTGSMITDPDVLKLYLARTGNTPTIIFIDEVHDMKRQVQEVLYEPMDSRMITTFQRTFFTLKLPPITIIAATTEPGKILQPFSTRFTHIMFKPYSVEEIAEILSKIQINGGEVEDGGLLAIAERSKLNPRLSLTNLKHVVTFCNQYSLETITRGIAERALDLWGVDDLGFTTIDWQYLNYLYETVEPQGIQNIAGMLSIDKKYIETYVEPYLLTTGIVIRGRSGRRLTPYGARIISERLEQ